MLAVFIAGSYFFKPNHIIVKANVPVELTADRESGITPHDSKELPLMAAHREQGMEGILEVVP